MSTMPMTGDFIRESLELHLFWARIMKEHVIFLESGFVCKDVGYIQEADAFKCQFEEILHEAICLSNGMVSAAVLQSGELFTDKTLMAEQKTQELSGIAINTQLTLEAMNLQPSMGVGIAMTPCEPSIDEQIRALNEKALACAYPLYQFTDRVYREVVQGCCLYTHNYPSIFHHQMEETKMYIKLIQRLQSQQVVDPTFQMVELEMLWTHLMKEHAEVIRQMLDPEEEKMIEKADKEAQTFKKIEEKFKDTVQPRATLKQITREIIVATESLRNFKAAGTDLILDCQLKSVIIVLLGDHVLREANHFLRLLRMPLPEFNGGKG